MDLPMGMSRYKQSSASRDGVFSNQEVGAIGTIGRHIARTGDSFLHSCMLPSWHGSNSHEASTLTGVYLELPKHPFFSRKKTQFLPLDQIGSACLDSNQEPRRYKLRALTIELQAGTPSVSLLRLREQLVCQTCRGRFC